MGRIYKPTRKATRSRRSVPVVIEYDHYYIEWTDSCGRTRRRKAGLNVCGREGRIATGGI